MNTLEEDLNLKKKSKRKVPLYAYVFVAILIILAGAYSYYMSLPDKYVNNKEIATIECVKLCSKELGQGKILSEGPCLSEEIAEGWVCDIVRNPRVKLIDNKEQNQCQNYINKVAKHFVEVDPECRFIRAE